MNKSDFLGSEISEGEGFAHFNKDIWGKKICFDFQKKKKNPLVQIIINIYVFINLTFSHFCP
jgi:hypothetical protein